MTSKSLNQILDEFNQTCDRILLDLDNANKKSILYVESEEDNFIAFDYKFINEKTYFLPGLSVNITDSSITISGRIE